MKFFKKRPSKHEVELALAQEKTKQLELEAKKASAQLEVARILVTEETKVCEPIKLEPPKLHPAVVPKGKKTPIAQDSAGTYEYANQFIGSGPEFYPSFLGYPLLAIMSQSSDYRAVAETTASSMTREWGKVKSRDDGENDEDKSDIVSKINQAMEDLNVRDHFRKHIENEMIFGRSQIFLDIKGHEDKTDLPLLIAQESIKKDSLNGFAVIEPIWSTPSAYNSTDPTKPDYFVPEKWYVLGKEIHADRLLTLVMRPVSDILKPAYNFSGLSMLQLMKPYVERWQRTTDSISDLIHSFSLTGLATDMEDVLSNNGCNNGIITRAMLFSKIKDNRGLMMTDKNKEEFFQFNTPLSGLDALQRQSQEHMAAPSHTPLVILLGLTPSGLNASSEGEIRVYYDYIASLQNSHILPQLKKLIDIIQLHLFGEIHKGIYFEFAPLYQLDDKELAEVNRINAETDEKYIQNGVTDGEEVRQRLATDEKSPYNFIDPSKEIPSPFGVPDFGNTEEESA